jgi:hypothetical protein
MTRISYSLDGLWDFIHDPNAAIQLDQLAEYAMRQCLVPSSWQAQFADLRDESGVAWYRRTITGAELAPLLAPGSTLIVHFGAVDYYATVWLNGTLLGEHEDGYLPFEFALDSALIADADNELVVRVIDPGDDDQQFTNLRFAEIPHGKQSWYGAMSGIWQSVYLERRSAIHLTRLHITPDVANAQAHVTLQWNDPTPESYRVSFMLTDPNDQQSEHMAMLEAGELRVTTTIPVPNPMLWDTRTPHLYQLTVTIQHDGETIDSLGDYFGMRTIATTAEGYLLLNDRVLYLRGALDQDYYPHTHYTPESSALLEAQFAKARHMGLNCLRTHIKIADPRYYAAADRAGLLIWTELPNWQELTPAARKRARDTLVGMVERDWNHPSIVIWTIINEGWGVDLAGNASHRAWLAETYAMLKELDPHRLVVGNSPCYTNFHVVTDIEDFHNYYAIPDHYRQWRSWVQVFASRPPWTFAQSYDSYDTWNEYMRDPWNPTPRSAAPEVQRRGNEPMIVSEFGNWGLPDIDTLREAYGGEPWWFETGREWGDGVAYPHGIEQRYRLFHLHRVFPTLADLTAASQRMQFTALKYQIEQMRQHQSIVGYIITEFTDVYWEANGLLDMCRNPKSFYDVIGNVNSADALVPDWERIVYWEGERCEVRLAFSHFSGLALHNCRIEWQLDRWPAINGSFAPINVPTGQVSPIGTIVFALPEVSESVRARLELRLLDETGECITANHHEIYVFPRNCGEPAQGANGSLRLYAQPTLAEPLAALGYRLTEDLEQAEIAVAETMTDQLRRYVQGGGKVLWLVNSSEAKQTYLGSLGIALRHGRSWQGDWASSMSWIKQTTLFRAIPTGGLVDFAFADLTPDYVIVGLHPRDYANDVHAGLFVGWLHHVVALIVEQNIDQGNLMICTFRLRDQLQNNPVAQIMLHDMLGHLATSNK